MKTMEDPRVQISRNTITSYMNFTFESQVFLRLNNATVRIILSKIKR